MAKEIPHRCPGCNANLTEIGFTWFRPKLLRAQHKVIEAAKALLHESEYWNQADLVGDLLETVEALEEVERA